MRIPQNQWRSNLTDLAGLYLGKYYFSQNIYFSSYTENRQNWSFIGSKSKKQDLYILDIYSVDSGDLKKKLTLKTAFFVKLAVFKLFVILWFTGSNIMRLLVNQCRQCQENEILKRVLVSKSILRDLYINSSTSFFTRVYWNLTCSIYLNRWWISDEWKFTIQRCQLHLQVYRFLS